MVSVFVIGHQQMFEFRNMAFGNHNQALAFGDHIVVRKDHRGTLVSVTENLGFHAVQAQLDGNIHRVAFFL